MAPRAGSSRGGVVPPGSGRPTVAALSRNQRTAARTSSNNRSAAPETDNTDAKSVYSTRSRAGTSAGAGTSTDPMQSPASQARARKKVPVLEMTREELEQVY
eukprot:6200259-Pleurochrysis_carterae.AAC.5